MCSRGVVRIKEVLIWGCSLGITNHFGFSIRRPGFKVKQGNLFHDCPGGSISYKKMKDSFNKKIYSLLKKVPKGKVTTYKILAEAIGTKAYRAVGQAMRCNPYAPVVPCHRVVKSDGSIGGFSGSKNPNGKKVKRKIRMLRKEGVEIINHKVINFEKVVFSFDSKMLHKV